MTRREALGAGAGVLASLAARPVPAGDDAGRSLAERLGFKKEDRLLMVHADDVGMCHSVNAASIRALTEGVASSGSVMVPCPWFPEIAAWAREHPKADLGIHLALTSEWSHYRWRPVAPPDQVKGLVDDDGFLWRTVEQVVQHAAPAEVETEIRAQVQRARKFGLQPTHVDSHMGTLFARGPFFDTYVRLSKELDVMPMLPGPTPEIVEEAKGLGYDYPALTRRLSGEGYVVLDRLHLGLRGKGYDERKKEFEQFVRDLGPGVTEIIVHLAGDDEEIRHVTASWAARHADFRICSDPATKRFLQEQDVRLIGYRELGRLWRK